MKQTSDIKISNKQLLFIWLLISLFFIPIQGVAYPKPCILNFPKEKYGADNKNWSIGEDERGIMYFGNDTGLLEFDGIGWHLNTLPQQTIIRAVAVLSHNTIFTGSYEEFGKWDRDISGKLNYTSLSKGLDKSLLKNDDFWKIWTAHNRVYFQSFNSIYVYDYKTIQKIPSDKTFLFLLPVDDGYWVQQMKGPIYRLQDRQLHQIEGSEIFSQSDVRLVLPYKKGQYLIGTAGDGIFLYDGSQFKEWNPSLSALFRQKDLNCGIRTQRGTYFWGTILDGFYETDEQGNILDHISTQNGLENNTALSVFEDRAGNIWAGLDRGLSYIQYLPKMSYYADPQHHLGSTYDAAIWHDYLFLATNQGVFFEKMETLKHSNNLSGMHLMDGTQGQTWAFSVVDDRLLCCHNRGVKEILPSMKAIDVFPDIGSGLYHLTEDKLKGKERLLFSTYNGLSIIDKDSQKTRGLDLISEPIQQAETDHLGNIWLEHFNKGVYRCRLTDDLKSIENYKYFGGNNNDTLPFKLKLFKVGKRINLLGDNRFYVYDDLTDRIVPNEKLNKCFSNIRNLRQIISIGENTYWALSNSVLYKFFYDGYKASIQESYDIGDRGLSLVNSYEHVAVLNDSTHLICLDNGFLLYHNKAQNDDTIRHIAKPYLESFKVVDNAGNPIYKNTESAHRLPFKCNTVSFRFASDKVLASNLSFQFYLDGVNENWSDPQKTNQATYPRLPMGKYSFKLRVVDNLGNSSEPLSYDFEILAPWYKTAWAYMAYAIVVILSIYAIWQIALRRYRKKHLSRLKAREERRLRNKNEYLERILDEKNTEILSQSTFVIQRNELLLKIKNELGDFGKNHNDKNLQALSKRINNMLDEQMDPEEDWKMFLINFEQKHNGFFKNLKRLYPQLTSNDLRLCACLRANLDSKEIAALMSLSVRSVENSRSRLRKKLSIPPQQHLNDFLLQF